MHIHVNEGYKVISVNKALDDGHYEYDFVYKETYVKSRAKFKYDIHDWDLAPMPEYDGGGCIVGITGEPMMNFKPMFTFYTNAKLTEEALIKIYAYYDLFILQQFRPTHMDPIEEEEIDYPMEVF